MRLLGIDYGTKRIGLAITDEGNKLAFPKEIILNNTDTMGRLGQVIKSESIAEIVIGESVDFSGALNALSARIEVFILELKERFGLPVHKQKEFLTSVEARKSGITNHRLRRGPAGSGRRVLNMSQAHSKVKQIKSGRVDAQAAALILQRYIDKINL